MKRLIAPLFMSLLAFFSVSSNAAIEDHFFFETSWGEEIKVHIIGSYSEPKYVLSASTVSSTQELAREFVLSTMARRNYRYEYGTCFDCQVSYEVPNSDEGLSIKPVIPLGSKTKSTILSKTDLANKFLEAIASGLGTRSANVVLDKAVTDKTPATSPFTISLAQDGRPMLICRHTANGCMTLENVLFTNFDKGGWGASYPTSDINGSAERIFSQELENALYEISKLHYICSITYTGIHGQQMVAQMVCFVSH